MADRSSFLNEIIGLQERTNIELFQHVLTLQTYGYVRIVAMTPLPALTKKLLIIKLLNYVTKDMNELKFKTFQ